MYEPVATTFYEKLNNLTILEFGLVHIPNLRYLEHLPMEYVIQIPRYIGRMLEIKCPLKENLQKSPKTLLDRNAGQLECCNLEECDFLQVKFTEYNNQQEYIEDTYLENDLIKEGYSANNLPKGLLLAFIQNNLEGNPTIHYEYGEFYSSYETLTKWSEDIIKEKQNVLKYDTIKFHWWKIERYECTLVGRDREWWLSVQPKIIDF